ncbi:MAG TPA: redoxin domain-containing protein [Streptosporangiaceae bacterium]|jgi:methylamine dehydrogenase accessory protein MauD
MPVGWAIAVVALWVAVIGLAIVILGLLRQVTPALERAGGSTGFSPSAQGPPIGDELPSFAARTADGQVIDESQLRGKPALLLFLSPGCGPCQTLAAEMSRTDLGSLADEILVVTAEEGLAGLDLPPSLRVIAELSREVSDALEVAGTPFAIAVDPAGVIRAKRIPNTVKHLRSIAAVLA